MYLQFATISVPFPHSTPEGQRVTHSFDSAVISAGVSLAGFKASYGTGDHHTHTSQVQITDIKLAAHSVSFNIIFVFDDYIGNQEHGSVDVLITALLAS
ncbi:MAG: hypothetical protein AAFQ68_15740 [Bacteroidota bacterium]